MNVEGCLGSRRKGTVEGEREYDNRGLETIKVYHIHIKYHN